MNNIAKQLIELAIQEDWGNGDHTSLSCIPQDAQNSAKLIAKESGIVAGIEVAKYIFNRIDNNVIIDVIKNDGDKVNVGDIVFKIQGNAQKILQSERLVLNFMQRMSGIATETAKYVELLNGLSTKILDTRKTTPGLRYFEKLAVKIGGGENHRMGLFDMMMFKDNHIDFAGGITLAINKAVEYQKLNNLSIPIEVEARSISEVQEILSTNCVNRIMLDNFTIDKTIEAVKIINKKTEIESSGGITYDTIRAYAKCGVDYISVGALTHHINSLDLSLKAL